MTCQPHKYYLTLPNGVPPYTNAFGFDVTTTVATPNEVIFDNRHSYLLSTPDYAGDLPWFIVTGRTGFIGQPFTGSDSILTERAVFQRNRTVVMLKPDAILMQLLVRLQATDGCDLSDIITRQLGHILSWDHATAVPCDTEGRDIAFPYDQPNPWTLTYEVCIDGQILQFHRDLSILWLDADDHSAGSGSSLTTTISMYSADSTWYLAPNIVLTGTQTQTGAAPVSYEIQPSGTPVFDFVYTGTSRTAWQLNFVPQVSLISAIALRTTDPSGKIRWRRFAHEQFTSGGGWAVTPGQGAVTLDIGEKVMSYNPGIGGDIDNYHLQTAVEETRQWDGFTLIPGQRHQIYIESPTGGTVASGVGLRYYNRYYGVG